MKSTKLMLAFIATFLITWCVIGLIGYLLSDLSYKECMSHTAMIYIMFLLGWIPGLIICSDLDKDY